MVYTYRVEKSEMKKMEDEIDKGKDEGWIKELDGEIDKIRKIANESDNSISSGFRLAGQVIVIIEMILKAVWNLEKRVHKLERKKSEVNK